MNRRTFVAASLATAAAPHILSAQTSAATPVASPVDGSKRRIIAASENGPSPEQETVQLFGEWIATGSRVLALPIAREDNDDRATSAPDRVWEGIRDFDIADMDVWRTSDIEANGFEPNLDAYGGIYLGDGSPEMLLQRLHASGLFTALGEAADRGCVLFGTSAGSMMFGANALAAGSPHRVSRTDLDPKEVHGLDLIRDEEDRPLIVVPHWRNGRTNIWDEAAAVTGLRVVLIPDGNAWTLNAGTYAASGPDELVWIG